MKIMTIEERIDTLINDLDAVLDYEPPSGLDLLVALIAKQVDEYELEEIMRG
jgi:hypothetical protein